MLRAINGLFKLPSTVSAFRPYSKDLFQTKPVAPLRFSQGREVEIGLSNLKMMLTTLAPGNNFEVKHNKGSAFYILGEDPFNHSTSDLDALHAKLSPLFRSYMPGPTNITMRDGKTQTRVPLVIFLPECFHHKHFEMAILQKLSEAPTIENKHKPI